MREVALTQGKVAFVDNEDYEKLVQYNWCAKKHRNTFYAIRHIWINGKRTTQGMHREILGLTNGDRAIIDHRDRNGINNQRYNLRDVSASINSFNRKKAINNSSGYRGVSWNKPTKKWITSYTYNKKRKHIGLFNDPIKAALAYDSAVLAYRGKDAVLNFPERINP